LKFRESKFALNNLFDISKPLWIFTLQSIGLGCVNNILVSSANNKEVDLLLTILGKSFIYNRNAVVPRQNLVACSVLSSNHLGSIVLFYFLLFIDTLISIIKK
jgi:hypothetical protein